MARASANFEEMGYEVEVTFGVNPGGTQQLVNFTDTTLGQTNETTNSNFIRSDTNVAGVIRTGVTAGGDIGIELQYGGYDSWIEAALRGTFSTALNISLTTISALNSDNSFNGSVTTEFADAEVGQWINVSGFSTNAVNNGYFKITAKPSNAKIIVAGATLIDETAGDTVVMKGALCKNAATNRSFTVERNFTDITQFLLLTGQRVSDLSLAFQLSAIANGTISFVGKDATSDTSTAMGGTTAAATTESMNTIDNVQAIYIDNAVTTIDFTQLDFAVTTNSEALNAIGNLNAVDVTTGSIGVTGNLTPYFEDATFIAKSLAYTSFALAWVVQDAAGNAYVFDFPVCKITGGGPDNPGINQTIIPPFTFTATYDATYGGTMGVTRIPA